MAPMEGHTAYWKTMMSWSPPQAWLTQEHRTLSNLNLLTRLNDFCQLLWAYLMAQRQHSPTARARNSGATLHSFLSFNLYQICHQVLPIYSSSMTQLLWLSRTTLGQVSSCYFSPGLFSDLLMASLFLLVSPIFHSPHREARVKLSKYKLAYFTLLLKTC